MSEHLIVTDGSAGPDWLRDELSFRQAEGATSVAVVVVPPGGPPDIDPAFDAAQGAGLPASVRWFPTFGRRELRALLGERPWASASLALAAASPTLATGRLARRTGVPLLALDVRRTRVRATASVPAAAQATPRVLVP